eukprot:gnl/MRDRNA2_/MRDRNA2_105900_c0_seq1.p1 gnl/MRDRNA2_/MRDRNA2_105900_c0~~gnl/MRDRNA2_/MRDRNA2_105900_c0_seq1.p1  ORF type:complete len:312 (-),score=43.18 gnl/MRDRNA2_/MRDRNA2_105900_c0_seq1:31-966(-)
MDEEVRLWKIWPSKNRIFFDGLCITGPQVAMLGGTFILVCLPFTLWRIVAYDWLLETAPTLSQLTVSCFVISVALLFRVSCSDPGILPRRDIAKALYPEVPEGPELEQLIDPFATTGAAKWCPTCLVHRPLKASHCQECDNCVLHFDNHCHLLNNCIGQRNYVVWLAFMISMATLAVLVLVGFALFWAGASIDTDPETRLPDNAPLLFLMLGAGCLIACLAMILISLLAYHLYAFVKMMATKDYRRESRGRPFIRGIIAANKLRGGHVSLFNLRQFVPAGPDGGRGGADGSGAYAPVDSTERDAEKEALIQ